MSELRRAAAELISSLDSVGGLESDEEGAPYEELKKRMDRMHDAVQSLRAILSTGDAEPVGWQPIEAAPKDGTHILVRKDGLVAAVYWWPEVWMGTTHCGMKNPTEWLPIPPAAKDEMRIAPTPEEIAIGYDRYEYIRTLNVTQFKELYEANIRGDGAFDELVDRGRKERE